MSYKNVMQLFSSIIIKQQTDYCLLQQKVAKTFPSWSVYVAFIHSFVGYFSGVIYQDLSAYFHDVNKIFIFIISRRRDESIETLL